VILGLTLQYFKFVRYLVLLQYKQAYILSACIYLDLEFKYCKGLDYLSCGTAGNQGIKWIQLDMAIQLCRPLLSFQDIQGRCLLCCFLLGCHDSCLYVYSYLSIMCHKHLLHRLEVTQDPVMRGITIVLGLKHNCHLNCFVLSIS